MKVSLKLMGQLYGMSITELYTIKSALKDYKHIGKTDSRILLDAEINHNIENKLSTLLDEIY